MEQNLLFENQLAGFERLSVKFQDFSASQILREIKLCHLNPQKLSFSK